jgi:hypothetical protein
MVENVSSTKSLYQIEISWAACCDDIERVQRGKLNCILPDAGCRNTVSKPFSAGKQEPFTDSFHPISKDAGLVCGPYSNKILRRELAMML